MKYCIYHHKTGDGATESQPDRNPALIVYRWLVVDGRHQSGGEIWAINRHKVGANSDPGT